MKKHTTTKDCGKHLRSRSSPSCSGAMVDHFSGTWTRGCQSLLQAQLCWLDSISDRGLLALTCRLDGSRGRKRAASKIP